MKLLMNKIYIIALVIASILFVFFMTQDRKEDIDPKVIRMSMIEEELQDRMDKFIKRRYNNCKKEYLEEAVFIVDSIISHELLLEAVDTMAFPERPFRPPYDAQDSLRIDSIAIEPLFLKIDSIAQLPI